jgi:hypothetical protein
VGSYTLEPLTGIEVEYDSRKTDFIENLTTAAAGIFLYAHLFVNDFLAHSPREPDFESIKLPKGLGGMCSDFLNREIASDENTWFNVYKTLLGLIAIAQGLNT